jgi:pre-mRNA-splicing factor SYF2
MYSNQRNSHHVCFGGRDEKRKNFSRRRPVHAEADIDYINDANAKFNQKIQRFFGESTSEIKQSLERGTAL